MSPERQVVWPQARSVFIRMLEERVIEGRKRYPEELTTHNGRDAIRDALEELIDAWQYVVQISLEHEALVSENAALRARVAELESDHA